MHGTGVTRRHLGEFIGIRDFPIKGYFPKTKTHPSMRQFLGRSGRFQEGVRMSAFVRSDVDAGRPCLTFLISQNVTFIDFVENRA